MSAPVRFLLIFVAVLLVLAVIKHPSGTGNTACYPNLTCHQSHQSHARVNRSHSPSVVRVRSR